MAINFPSSPSVDDTYTYLDQTWICTSASPVIWERSTATETGNTEGNTGEIAYYDAKGSIIKGATAFYYDSTNLKVGIGTSGPDQTLGVSGDFYVSGGATLAGAMVIQGNNVTGVTFSGGATFYNGLGLPTDQSIHDSSGNPIFTTEGDRFINLGDTDVSGNNTYMYIRDSHSVIEINADTSVSIQTPVIYFPESIAHSADPNTRIVCQENDTLALQAGGVTFAQGVYDTIYTKLGAPQGITASNRSEFDGITADQFAVRSGGISCDAGATFGGRTRIHTDDAQAKQLTLGGASDNNKRLYVGYDTTNNHGNIQAIQEGTAYSNLALQAGGGNVGIGTDSPSEKLQVVGNTHLTGGLSADAGATFGGDVWHYGNIYLPEDGAIQIGNDIEKIVFNGSGSGSSSIDMSVSMVDFGNGSGAKLRSHGDTDTMLNFENDLHGGGNDGLQLIQSNNVMVDVGPTYVNVAGATFGGGGGATFGGNVVITNAGDALLTLYADSDDSGENDNPYIDFRQDDGANSFQMGMVGNAGQIYTDSRSNVPYINSFWGMQVGTNTDLAIDIDRYGLVHLTGGLSADAGATFDGAVNLQDNELTRPKLKDYSETVKAHGSQTSTTNLSYADGNVHTLTIGADLTIGITNPPADGIAGALTLILTNGAAHTVTWDSDIQWPGGNAPSLTASGVDIISFLTTDAGGDIYGFVGGINFS